MFADQFEEFLKPVNLSGRENTPDVDEMLKFLIKQFKLDIVELGDGDPMGIARAEENQLLAITSLDPCVGYIAFNPQSGLASGKHQTPYFRPDLKRVIEQHEDKKGLYILTAGALYKPDDRVDLEQSSFLDADLTEQELLEVVSKYGLDKDQIYMRDGVNVAKHRKLSGMSLVVVPKLKIALVFGDSDPSEDNNDRLIETISLE